MSMNKRRIHHVFVTALSTFPHTGKLEKTTYQFMEPLRNSNNDDTDEELVTYSWDGFYQLDPIPRFITHKLGYTITDVILLATDDVKKNKSIEPAWDETPGPQDISPLCYYKKRLKYKLCDNPTINIVPIDVNENSPQNALEDVMSKIRELYEDTDDEAPDSWKLWFDTHGGFRDISMVMVSAARFFATDKHDPIRTDSIFSVYHSQNSHTDRIVDQTGFYFTDSAQSLRDFLNFGQYLAMSFSPYEGKKPYGFVSYRHDRHFYTHIRNVFTWFKKSGILYWFDEGIKYGDNWRDELENKNNNASAFIMLLTKSYFDSVECWKEMVRAVYHAKKDKADGFIHIFFLEENITIPAALPKDEKFCEARNLAKELGVTDSDIFKWLGHQDNTQWLQWYQYMDNQSAVNEWNLHMDDRLDSVVNKIQSVLTS